MLSLTEDDKTTLGLVKVRLPGSKRCEPPPTAPAGAWRPQMQRREPHMPRRAARGPRRRTPAIDSTG